MLQSTMTPEVTNLFESPSAPLQFRIQGDDQGKSVTYLDSAKYTIGSSPTCTLQITGEGVRPVHCLILRGRRQTVVRRWAPETRINGIAVDSAPLLSGDRLRIGTVELEFLSSQATTEPGPTPKSANAALKSADLLDMKIVKRIRNRSRQLLAALREEREIASRRLHELEMMRADHDAAIHRSEAFKASHASMQKEQSASGELISQLTNELETERGRWDGERNAWKDEKAAWEEERRRLEKEQNEWNDQQQHVLRTQVDREKEWDEERTKLEDFTRSITTELDDLRKETTGLRHRLAVSETESLERNGKITTERQEIEHREQKLDRNTQELADRERAIEHREQEIEHRKEELDQWQTDLSARAEEVEQRLQALAEDEAVASFSSEESHRVEGRLDEMLQQVQVTQGTHLDAGSPNTNSIAPSETEPWTITESDKVARSEVALENGDWEERGPVAHPSGGFVSEEHAQQAEAALAHLRELRVLGDDLDDYTESRQESSENTAVETAAETEETAADVAEPTAAGAVAHDKADQDAAGYQPTSFIDRYAEMFDDERDEREVECRIPSSDPNMSTRLVGEPDRDDLPNKLPRNVDEHEESIEQYMSQLLQRVRGETASLDIPTVSEPVPEPEETTVVSPTSNDPLDDSVAKNSDKKQADSLLRLEEIKQTKPLPERQGNFDALRQLANTTAYEAIGTHTNRVKQHRALSKVLTSTVGFMGGAILLCLSHSWTDPMTYYGAVSIAVGFIWLGQTTDLLLKATRHGTPDGIEVGKASS